MPNMKNGVAVSIIFCSAPFQRGSFLLPLQDNIIDKSKLQIKKMQQKEINK
jgi:hypothetical protein